MNRKIIICIIAIVIMCVGAVMANVIGFNKGLEYGDYTRILVYMNKESNLDDVKGIVSDVFGGRFEVSYTDEFKDTVSIKAQGISDEQIENLKNKLKEKYEFEDDAEYMITLNTASIGTFELIKDYIKPVAISYVLILVYFAFAYRKLGLVNGLVIPAIVIVIISSLYVSLIAICGISLNSFIIPLGVLLYIASLLGTTMYLNSKNKAEN